MATYYLDYEGGSDAGIGTSFATRWKTLTLGATAARIAPGDTIRIMGSPAVQSFGMNGTWTSSKLEATKSITSSTNASPIVITLASHGYATGDTVVVTGHTTNTKANGTWEIISVTSGTFSLTGSTGNGVGGATGTVRLRNNSRVIMASDTVVKNLASHGNVGSGRTAWTASANVTTSLNTTDFKEGDSSDSIAIGASFTTGLAAYKATTSTLASTCATTSFWIKQTAGTVAVASDVSIRLCSDVAGATSIKTIPVPGLVTLNRWTVVSVDTSGLTGNIQSVALYVDADKGAQTFLLCNIIGSGSDQVDLSCLIGKNTGTGMDAEPWCPIQSINSTRIMLDGEANLTPISTTLRGYYGTTETVTTYFRKTIKTAIASTSTIVQSITDSGTAGSPITFSGGWDRTDMSTQTLETFFDGQNSQGNGIDLSSKSYVTMDKINCVRYYAGYNSSGTFQTISNAQCVACSQASFWLLSNFNQNAVSNCLAGFSSYGFWIYNGASSNRISNVKSLGNQNYGLITQSGAFNNFVSSGNIFNNGVDGINIFEASQNTFKNINSYANNSYGIIASSSGGSTNNTFINCSASNANSTGWNMQGYNYLTNCTAVSNTSSQFLSNPGVRGGDDGIYSMDHTGVSGNTSILMSSGSVVSTTSVRHTSSGIAWALAPTSVRDRPSDYPLTLKIATLAVAADNAVTVKAWLRRTNTGLTLGLRILADQIAGVSSDILSPMTAVADTWEEVTLTFTPTANGVVKIQAYCYGGSTYTGYVDDLTITQASLAAALTPAFGSTTATADGFTVQISNYDALYTWAGTATASGTVVVSGSGLVTVTNVAGSTSSTATITTTRTGYIGGSATVTETSLTSFSSTSEILSSTSNYTVPVGAKVIKIWSIGAGGSATFLCDGGGGTAGNAGVAAYTHGFISNTNVVVNGSIGQPVASVCDLSTAGGSTTLSNLSTVISPSISSIVGGGGGAGGFVADRASSGNLSTHTLWTNSTTRRDYVGVNAVITAAGGNATTHTYGKGAATGTGSAGAIVLQFLSATDLVLPFTGSGSFTIPAGYGSVKIWAVGGGGIGDIYCDGGPTTSGGYGGIAFKTWSVSSGQVITYSAGAALSGVANSFCTNPTNGNASTATLDSITITGSAGLGNGTNGSGSGGDGSGVYGSDVSSIYAAYATYSTSTPTYGLRGVSTNTAGLIGGIVLVKFMV